MEINCHLPRPVWDGIPIFLLRIRFAPSFFYVCEAENVASRHCGSFRVELFNEKNLFSSVLGLQEVELRGEGESVSFPASKRGKSLTSTVWSVTLSGGYFSFP